mmetsp:Transcript_7420/g.19471  ORF Transcript_7420/g.19471 Transcript_7420/m.19471 type:complete len:355 (+) Transcript_7420:102-1166(+)
MDPAVMRLIGARGGGEAAASLAPMIRRQESLPPIKIKGRSFVKLALIKQTATSVVHKACSPRDNSTLDTFGEGVRKICAVKKMQLGDNALADRAREELAILQSLAAIPDASNHVVMLLESESQACELKLVMECGDQDLSNWVPSSSFQMLDALEQAIAALAWLHSVRVVHLDVKPANFLLFPHHECQARRLWHCHAPWRGRRRDAHERRSVRRHARLPRTRSPRPPGCRWAVHRLRLREDGRMGDGRHDPHDALRRKATALSRERRAGCRGTAPRAFGGAGTRQRGLPRCPLRDRPRVPRADPGMPAPFAREPTECDLAAADSESELLRTDLDRCSGSCRHQLIARAASVLCQI